MEPQTQPRDYRSSVDSSRPFRSVKEAVAIFGERLVVGEIYCPKPYAFTPPRHESPEEMSNESNQLSQWNHHNHCRQEEHDFLVALKKLEVELENTKAELRVLRERESVMEVALASLNAELHKNKSKLAEVEAVAARKAAASFGKIDVMREEERRKELKKRMENNQTLAHILSIGGEEFFGGRRERKMMKKKPIVPLVGDWFFKKKWESEYFP
ncbi:hypothetical protein SLEP1_g40813 [Rubroshorea leprosula]|uniref:WEB family protein n=1 Tax=Rubroshorea leprosula TaxID=152421 RepID=A0AAV5L4Y9_9ROSI|nr:hypothetical protein SLEP1_g40813 [Rubroshorea leprosula]